MSRVSGHYVPVAARREVLKIYRDRRKHGDVLVGRSLTPIAAMVATVRYFEGWLAHGVAFGPAGPRQTIQSLTDEYRAAEYYLNRMCNKPEQFRRRA